MKLRIIKFQSAARIIPAASFLFANHIKAGDFSKYQVDAYAEGDNVLTKVK
jgi:hypothetical protein